MYGFYYAASQEGRVVGRKITCPNPIPFALSAVGCTGGEREESDGLFRELITWREELLEELCFEFSDAFLKAGCCSLAIWSKSLVFCLSFFPDLSVVTAVLLVCFSYSAIILMHLSYSVLIFIFSTLLLCCYCNLHPFPVSPELYSM